MLERARWLPRWGAAHALWLGRQGLWDFGAKPGWRRPAAPGPAALASAVTAAVAPSMAVPPSAMAAAARPVSAVAGPVASTATNPAFFSAAPASPASSGPVHHASFDAWCQAHPGARCELALSSWLLHELLLDPALPLADDHARLAYARGLLQHYHGDDAADWPLAAWQLAGRQGVSALHGVRLSALQHSARQAGVALRAVRPWWSVALALARPAMLSAALPAAPPAVSPAAWPAARPADPSSAWRLLVVDGSLVTQIDLVGGRLAGLQNRRLAAAEGAALQSLVDDAPAGHCHALGHGLAAPVVLPPGLVALAPLDGPAPAALWRAVDVDPQRLPT